MHKVLVAPEPVQLIIGLREVTGSMPVFATTCSIGCLRWIGRAYSVTLVTESRTRANAHYYCAVLRNFINVDA